MTRSAIFSCLFALVGALFWPGSAKAAKDCGKLYKDKKYIASAACFERSAKGVKTTPKMTLQQRIFKGRSLRNATVALRKAAALEKKVERAAYLRHRAVLLLQQYLREKLYTRAYLKKTTSAKILELQKKIGAAPLTIVANDPKARISIKGFRFEATGTGQWSQTVRPGPYKVRVAYPQSPKPITRQLQVQPKRPLVVTTTPPSRPKAITRRLTKVRPPTPRRPTLPPTPPPSNGGRIAAWVLLGTGAAAAVTGGILLGLGQAADAKKQELHQTFTGATPTDQLKKYSNYGALINEHHQTSTTLLPAGWVVLGGGVAVAATGALLYFLAPASRPATPGTP